MKKITLLVAVIVATSFASCKKAAKCECTTTTSSVTNGVPDTMPAGWSNTTTSTREISKTGKKTAAALCGNTTTTSSDTGPSYTKVTTTSSTCSIK